MFKTYDVRKLCRDEGGEYVLGMKDLATHACYLIYGELGPGESGRKVCPGGGHEEILIAVCGELELSGDVSGRLAEGMAVHLREEQTCELKNPGDAAAVYIMAGGHSGKPH